MKFIKILCCIFAALAVVNFAHADYTKGYIKRNGTYVSGYHRTRSDGVKMNNYSTKGNINPYTGRRGYKSPYKF